MTRPEFSRTLEDSGVRVKGWEKEALLDRFEDGRLSGKVTGGGIKRSQIATSCLSDTYGNTPVYFLRDYDCLDSNRSFIPAHLVAAVEAVLPCDFGDFHSTLRRLEPPLYIATPSLAPQVNWRDFVSVMQAADLDESRAAKDVITSSFYQHRSLQQSSSSSSSSHWSNGINGHIDMTVGSLMGILDPSDRRNKPLRDNQNKTGNQRRDNDHAPRTLGVNYTRQPLRSGVLSTTFGSEGLPPKALTARDAVNARRWGRINGVSNASLAEPSGGGRKWMPFKEAFMKGKGTGVTTKVPFGVDNSAEVLRVLDDLLGDQRELETFLEEEIEKRLTFKKEERVALDREGL